MGVYVIIDPTVETVACVESQIVGSNLIFNGHGAIADEIEAKLPNGEVLTNVINFIFHVFYVINNMMNI